MIALVLTGAYAATAVAAQKTICEAGCSWQSSAFGGGEYRPSAKVTVDATTSPTNYCATTQHSGAAANVDAGRQFGTISTSPQILWAASESTPGPKTCTDATALAAPSRAITGGTAAWAQ